MRKLKKRTLRLALVIALLPLLGASQCNPSVKTRQAIVDELLTSFEGGCSAGAWTAAALDRSARLTGAYKSLTAKASCKDNGNLNEALLGASAFNSALSDALEHEQYYRAERVAEENSNDLYFALQSPGLSPSLKTELLSYYASQRYELSYNRAALSYLQNPSYASRGASGLGRFNSVSSAMLTHTSQLSSCLADNPAKAVDIAANVGLVAGAFAPPMIGLSVAAISQLLKLGVDAATTIPGARAIYKSRKARMPSAMTCGLEALTRDYCKARDAYALVSLSRRDLVGREPSPFFYGIELADRDLPLLYQWLDKVVGGSNSASLDQATKVNEQFSRLNRILQMERNTDGIFGQLEQDLRNPRFTDSDRLSTLKRALRDLMLSALFAEMDMGRPYAYPDGPFTTDNPYYLLAELVGVTNPPEPKDGESINFYIGRLNLRYTDKLPGEIRDRTVALLAARHQRVLAEFIEKVNLNPSVVIREASAQTPGGLSAVYTLERLDRFFDIFALGAGAERAQDEELIRQVRGDLADLKTALTAPEATQPRRAEEIITSVFAKFKLENTNVFLPTHLQSLVRNDLTTRYRRGEGPKDVEDILTTAGRDIDSLLTRTKLGPLEVRGDLELAQSTTLSTLGQFRDFFAPNIAEAMEDLLKQADKNHEPPLAPGSRSPSRHTLARLCLLTLLSGPDWPKDIDKALCRGARMFSPDASLELSFDALDSRFNEAREPIALDDRLCLHQEFLRLDRLASQGLKAPGDAAVHDSGFDPAFWQDALDSRLR